MAASATLNRRNQVSIPRSVLDEKHWKAGQEFVFVPKGRGVLLMPVPDLGDLKGMAEGADSHGVRDREDRI